MKELELIAKIRILIMQNEREILIGPHNSAEVAAKILHDARLLDELVDKFIRRDLENNRK